MPPPIDTGGKTAAKIPGGDLMEKNQRILRLAVTAGEILVRNGAEISRAYDTVTRILHAFGITDYQVYVLSNGLFASTGEQADTVDEQAFAVRYIPLGPVHLGRISAVNEASREITAAPEEWEIDRYREKLRAAGAIPFFPLPLQAAACGLASFASAYLFGGGIPDCLAAFLCGLLLQWLLGSVKGFGTASRFMPTLVGSAFVTLLAAVMNQLIAGLVLDHIIVGAIISLVPGVVFTTSIRDFFNGDFISGTIHLVDALLTGVCIAAGVGTTLLFWQWLGGVIV